MILGYPEVETPTRLKEFNEELRDRLEAYRAENGLSRAALGIQLGFSGTVVSKYLNGKPEGDVAKFEALAEDTLKNAEQRKHLKLSILNTSVATDIEGTLHLIRKTNDIGLVTGNAGIGKSKAAERFRNLNPTSILIVCTKWVCNYSDIVREFWKAIETSGWTGKIKRIDYILQRFIESNRLIIFDNAHRMKPGAWDFAFDFYDATNCPLGFIANPEVIDKLQKNDQHFSRIGPHKHIQAVERKYKDAESREAVLATAIISQVAPQFEDCLDLAEKVIANRGHLRALRKLLSLADDLAGSHAFKTLPPDQINRAAFKAAHKHLIRNYDL
jgi:DNA transposition AAA+ family ATPase